MAQLAYRSDSCNNYKFVTKGKLETGQVRGNGKINKVAYWKETVGGVKDIHSTGMACRFHPPTKTSRPVSLLVAKFGVPPATGHLLGSLDDPGGEVAFVKGVRLCVPVTHPEEYSISQIHVCTVHAVIQREHYHKVHLAQLQLSHWALPFLSRHRLCVVQYVQHSTERCVLYT